MKMSSRMDFDFVKGKPVLVGLTLEGFGWIVGGATSGTVSIEAEVDLDTAILRKGSATSLRKLKKLLREYDYYKNGHRTFDVKSNQR